MNLTLTRKRPSALTATVSRSFPGVRDSRLVGETKPGGKGPGKEKTSPTETVTRVTIQYCELANYSHAAHELARAIEAEFRDADVHTELVPASGGVYEVSINGQLVYSKKATYRLPDCDEIFYHIRAVLPRGPGEPPLPSGTGGT